MPTYLVITQEIPGAGPGFDYIVAADLPAAAAAAKAKYAQGMSITGGQRNVLLVGLIEFQATGTITPNANPASATSTYAERTKQPTIANLAAGATAATIVTKVNAILAMLRANGTIDP